MRYARLIYDYDLPHRAVAVYMYLSNRANKDNTCFPSVINYIKGFCCRDKGSDILSETAGAGVIKAVCSN